MKCPKDFDRPAHQQTLAEMWFGKKRSHSEANIESDLNQYSCAKKFAASPKKTSPLKSTIFNDLPTMGTSQITETENNSDDDIVASSQDTRESKLRNKINATCARKSATPVTPNKLSQLFDSPSKNSSFSEVFKVSSTVIKEEMLELLDDMQGFESIEMTHNLSDLLVDGTSSPNILDCTSPLSDLVKLESLTEDEDVNPGELRDPLEIDEKIEQLRYKKPTLVPKEKRTVMAKKIGKNKLKHILPSSSKSSSEKKFSKVMDESKSNGRRSIIRNNVDKTESKTDLLSEELVKVLKTLKIQLQHEVPPQHMIETSAGARNLNPEQIAEFEKYGPMKKGPFSKEEDKIIKKNWEMFCNIHNWDKNNVVPFLYMRHEGKYYIRAIEERKKFVRFLANGLPWRSLYSVYNRFRTIYNTSVNNGPYTLKEDKKILSYMRKASSAADNKCAELAKLLHRKRQSIWTRYQKLKIHYNLSDEKKEKEKKSPKKKKKTKPKKIHLYKRTPKIFTNVKWSCPLVKKFIDSLLESTACNDLVDLKDEKIDDQVWRKMESKMCIDRIVLENFWYLQLHMQLFCPTPIYLNDTKVKLIKHMYAEKFKNLQDVDWESISLHFNGITPYFLSKLFEQLLNCARKNFEVSHLSDALEYLHENYMPILIAKSIDAILPKLFYHNGKIICIDKGSEKKIPNKFTSNPFSDEDET